MSTKRTLLAAGTAGVVGLSGMVGLATVATATSDDDATPPGATVTERVERLTDALSGLVEEGTIDKAQAEAVAEELAQQPGFGRGPGWGHEGMRAAMGVGLEVAAETLGLTEDEVREALRDGSTLADLAEAEGVTTQTLVDALVAAAEERIAAAVEDGRLTQEQADERLADLADRVTSHVEDGGPGADGLGRQGHGRGAGMGTGPGAGNGMRGGWDA